MIMTNMFHHLFTALNDIYGWKVSLIGKMNGLSSMNNARVSLVNRDNNLIDYLNPVSNDNYMNSSLEFHVKKFIKKFS